MYIWIKVTVFVQYLNAYATTVKKWSIFSRFENIKANLDQINKVILSCIEFLLSIVDQVVDDKLLVIICDQLEEQKNFINNVGFLPLYVPEKGALSFLKKRIGKNKILELDEPDKVVEYLASQKSVKSDQSQADSDDVEQFEKTPEAQENQEVKTSTARHQSYELLGSALDILASRIYHFKETESLDDTLTMIERYFDILGELIKQLDQQLDASDLDKYASEKMRMFEHCRKIEKLQDLNAYLSALKRYFLKF